jgi:hypothetical protein
MTTLTNLIPDLYSNLDVVSRELTGFIPSVTLDPEASRAAVGQTVRSFVAPTQSAADISPGVTPPNDGDQTIGNVPITISKARRVPIRWSGEDDLGANSGPGASNIRAQQIQQAFRTLANEIEADIAALYASASNAVGAAGTTPFATAGDLTGVSLARKALVDNGAPESDMHLVIDTSAGANLRGKHAAANVQGTDSMLRQGLLLDTSGMMVRESGQVKSHTAGTGASATTDNAGYGVGDTVITLASAGTGTILAGDVITFAGDSTQYVVASGDADVSGGGTITLAAPGLKVAIAASTTAITVVATSVRNMAFHRGAICLAQRLPALPQGGDLAVDREVVTDPRSGLSFEIAMYPQYRQMQWEVSAAWGVAMIKPDHCVALLG